jgi:hypothetical protein
VNRGLLIGAKARVDFIRAANVVEACARHLAEHETSPGRRSAVI